MQPQSDLTVHYNSLSLKLCNSICVLWNMSFATPNLTPLIALYVPKQNVYIKLWLVQTILYVALTKFWHLGRKQDINLVLLDSSTTYSALTTWFASQVSLTCPSSCTATCRIRVVPQQHACGLHMTKAHCQFKWRTSTWIYTLHVLLKLNAHTQLQALIINSLSSRSADGNFGHQSQIWIALTPLMAHLHQFESNVLKNWLALHKYTIAKRFANTRLWWFFLKLLPQH